MLEVSEDILESSIKGNGLFTYLQEQVEFIFFNDHVYRFIACKNTL